jgi:hypothetical protein
MNDNSDATSSQPKDLTKSKKDPDSDFIAPNLQKTNSWLIRSKGLSPEFSNIKDEVELGKMMGDDGEKLLALVDDIRKIDSLRDAELHIPQVFLAPIKLLTVADVNKDCGHWRNKHWEVLRPPSPHPTPVPSC